MNSDKPSDNLCRYLCLLGEGVRTPHSSLDSSPWQGGGREGVLFIDASREYKAGKNQNLLTTENIRKVLETYQTGKSVEKYAYLASLAEIRENDYNLNIPRYVDTFEEEAEIDLMEIRRERLQLQQQLAALETEMAGYLQELGYE